MFVRTWEFDSPLGHFSLTIRNTLYGECRIAGMDPLHDLECEERLREAYTLARHVAESYERHLTQNSKPILSPFWELRMIERMTLVLYLEQSSRGLLTAEQLLAYASGAKLLEGADRLRGASLITPAVEDLLSSLKAPSEARVGYKITALALDALLILEEQNFDRRTHALGQWD